MSVTAPVGELGSFGLIKKKYLPWT